MGNTFRNLMGWDPFRDLAEFRGLFSDGATQPTMAFDLDMAETPEGYVVTADLPGFSRKDVNITLQEGVLVIDAERKHEQTREGEQFFVRERFVGRFQRALRLPTAVKDSSINATLKDGVLKIELAKADEVRPRRIEVKGDETPAKK
jgi:HSP20 family protein